MKLFFNLIAILAATTLLSCGSRITKTTDTGSFPLKIMAYNVHHCNPPDKPGVIDVDGIAEILKSQAADIVAIQEVDVNTKRSGEIDQAGLLAQKAGYPDYYFGKAIDYSGGDYGVLVLSKYPITDSRTILLPMVDTGSRYEQRIVALATISLPNGKSLLFGSTHLEAYSKTNRLLQAKELSKLAENAKMPLIIAGDFNAEEGSEEMDIIDKKFARTCSGCANTYWEDSTTGAIDFITFSPKKAFEVVSHKVLNKEVASDHFPIVAELKMNNSK